MRLRNLGSTLVFAGLLAAAPLRAGELRSVTERTIDAPPAVVWGLLTTKEGLQKWLSTEVTLEMRVGGRVETVETRARMEGKLIRMILAYDPGRMIAVRPLLIPGTVSDRSVWEMSWLVITVDPAGEKQALVRVVGLVPTGFPASEGILNDLKESNRRMLERIALVATGKTVPPYTP